jgi:hypothetical protein
MSEDRSRRGLRDLVLSMAVVGAFVAFLYAVVWRPAPDPVRTVDTGQALAAAEAEAGYEVLAPEGLSEQWRPTAVRFEPTAAGSTWFLGFVTPEDQYIAVAQTDGDPADFIDEQTLSGMPDGQRDAAGRTWLQFASDDQRSLVSTTDESTTVVTGTVGYDELAAFAERLS